MQALGCLVPDRVRTILERPLYFLLSCTDAQESLDALLRLRSSLEHRSRGGSAGSSLPLQISDRVVASSEDDDDQKEVSETNDSGETGILNDLWIGSPGHMLPSFA